MLKVCAWNTRGLNNPLKQKVLSLVHTQNLGLIGLVETKLHSTNLDSAIRHCVPATWLYVHNCGTDVVARIVVAGNPQVMTVSLLFSSPQLLVVRVVWLECHKDFCVSIIYGHNCVVARRQSWSDMNLVGGVVGNDPWLQMGDFNVVQKTNERLEGFDRAVSTEFNDCLASLEMDDTLAKGFWHTWTNKHGGLGANMSKNLIGL